MTNHACRLGTLFCRLAHHTLQRRPSGGSTDRSFALGPPIRERRSSQRQAEGSYFRLAPREHRQRDDAGNGQHVRA